MHLQLTKLTMDEKNRMLRVAIGKNDGRWFFRIDLWSVGYRITNKQLKIESL